MHRDLKPENILFETPDPHSRIMIADFGIAVKLVHDEETGQACVGYKDIPSVDNYKLGTTEFVGTLGYLAPEVMVNLPQTEKIDIWTIGYV